MEGGEAPGEQEGPRGRSDPPSLDTDLSPSAQVTLSRSLGHGDEGSSCGRLNEVKQGDGVLSIIRTL